jgi:glucuronate isomerase
LRIDKPETFLPWLQYLREASNIDIRDLPTLLGTLRKRHDHFNHGCRSSDHGLTRGYGEICDEGTAAKVFNTALSGQSTTPDDLESYASFLTLFFGRLDAEKGRLKQLHLGASRNLSTRAYEKPGPDTGFDAIGDQSQGAALAKYDLLQRQAALPRMILYNSNPADNYLFATIAVSFQVSHNVSGVLQHRSGLVVS